MSGGENGADEGEERLEEDAFRQVMQTASAPGKVISKQVCSSTAAMVALTSPRCAPCQGPVIISLKLSG